MKKKDWELTEREKKERDRKKKLLGLAQEHDKAREMELVQRYKMPDEAGRCKEVPNAKYVDVDDKQLVIILISGPAQHHRSPFDSFRAVLLKVRCWPIFVADPEPSEPVRLLLGRTLKSTVLADFAGRSGDITGGLKVKKCRY